MIMLNQVRVYPFLSIMLLARIMQRSDDFARGRVFLTNVLDFLGLETAAAVSGGKPEDWAGGLGFAGRA
jgi:hypothetical protein